MSANPARALRTVQVPSFQSLEPRRLFSTTYSITDLNCGSGTSAGDDASADTGVDVNSKGVTSGSNFAHSVNSVAGERLPTVGAELPTILSVATSAGFSAVSYSKGINDRGDMVGHYTGSDGQTRAFLAEAVEPHF